MQGDIEHIRDRQERENFRFTIIEVGGNQQSKDQRIERLMPLFRDKMIITPATIVHQNSAGEPIDVMKYFMSRNILVGLIILSNGIYSMRSRDSVTMRRSITSGREGTANRRR